MITMKKERKEKTKSEKEEIKRLKDTQRFIFCSLLMYRFILTCLKLCEFSWENNIYKVIIFPFFLFSISYLIFLNFSYFFKIEGIEQCLDFTKKTGEGDWAKYKREIERKFEDFSPFDILKKGYVCGVIRMWNNEVMRIFCYLLKVNILFAVDLELSNSYQIDYRLLKVKLSSTLTWKHAELSNFLLIKKSKKFVFFYVSMWHWPSPLKASSSSSS